MYVRHGVSETWSVVAEPCLRRRSWARANPASVAQSSAKGDICSFLLLLYSIQRVCLKSSIAQRHTTSRRDMLPKSPAQRSPLVTTQEPCHPTVAPDLTRTVFPIAPDISRVPRTAKVKNANGNVHTQRSAQGVLVPSSDRLEEPRAQGQYVLHRTPPVAGYD